MATPASHSMASRFALTHSAYTRSVDPRTERAPSSSHVHQDLEHVWKQMHHCEVEQSLQTLQHEGAGSGEDPLLRTAHRCMRSSSVYDFAMQFADDLEHNHQRFCMGLVYIEQDQQRLEKLLARLLEMERLACNFHCQVYGPRSLRNDFLTLKWRIQTTAIPLINAAADDFRTAFHAAIRPFARNIHITELPVEVLCIIFAYVEGGIDYTSLCAFDLLQHNISKLRDIQSIKNVRLTCKLFSNASARLLVRMLRLDISKESLEHLDRVSHHPTISRGIRVVCVNLHHYSSTLAEHQVEFATYALDTLYLWHEQILLCNSLVSFSPEARTALSRALFKHEPAWEPQLSPRVYTPKT